ncbi:PAS domain S-box-containing protein [Archangium gephyra]|uniref:histidine kinase n=1 Tax=Archangium gephyra TaxID=48 RepID=A0AAC8TD24_9BACT|nr:PAS domain-containing protein [Archangium gephyra]AKJ00031.1 sensory box histidine kinase [Archangium gephyra]REG33264.1 PAS domain S-box-containing protein [Archangium gephyra]
MGALAELLATRREDILQRFEREVRAHFPVEGQPRSVIRDTLPQLLDELYGLLSAPSTGESPSAIRGQLLQTAREHRAQRHALGYDVTQIVREYSLVRDCILGLIEESGGVVVLSEQRILHRGLDLAMSDAVANSEHGRDEERQRGEEERTALLERERTARAEAERQRALLEGVIAQSGDAIIVADAQGVLRLFNSEAERQHGVPLKEIGPREWVETYGLSDEAGHPLALERVPLYRALQGEHVRDEPLWLHRPDGTRLPVSVTARPLRGPDGTAAGAVYSARDVALRRALAQEREEALALLDTLLATVPVGLSFLDKELRYVRINPTLAAINGVSVEQTLGRTAWEVIPHIAPHIAPTCRRVLETGEPELNLELSIPSPRRGGAPGHYLVSYAPVKDGEGRPIMVAAAVVDITELKRFEERLRQTAEFRERFLGIVSHDLRNPLSIITLSATLLLRQEALPERALRLAQRISLNAEQMARMIGDLLDLTRGRLGGGIPISPAPCDLGSLGRRVVSELEVAHPARELRLEARGDLQGEWDQDRLAQLLGNLLRNAVDYSPEGTPITLALRGEGEQVRLEVHNQGEPIAAEVLPGLFEPFRRGQTRGSGSTSGLGLGLYIVQQIAAAHGGGVEARSTREEGTVFTVRLPRLAPRRG